MRRRRPAANHCEAQEVFGLPSKAFAARKPGKSASSLSTKRTLQPVCGTSVAEEGWLLDASTSVRPSSSTARQ